MIYKFIENLSRLILEWSLRKQNIHRHIVDEIGEAYSYQKLRTERVKKALL